MSQPLLFYRVLRGVGTDADSGQSIAVRCVTDKTPNKKQEPIDDRTKKRKEDINIQDLKKYYDVHVSIADF